MSRRCVALHLAKSLPFTDKQAKNGTLSVKFERNPGAPTKIRKNTRHHGTYFNHYSVDRSASHLVLIRFQLAFPLSQARTPWTRQARLRSPKACVRGHTRSLPHLVLIRFQLAFPLSQARTPWTRQARLRSPKACVRAHERSASHLVLSSFILTKSFVKMPATFFSINSFASFSSSIVQMR